MKQKLKKIEKKKREKKFKEDFWYTEYFSSVYVLLIKIRNRFEFHGFVLKYKHPKSGLSGLRVLGKTYKIVQETKNNLKFFPDPKMVKDIFFSFGSMSCDLFDLVVFLSILFLDRTKKKHWNKKDIEQNIKLFFVIVFLFFEITYKS